MSSSCRQGGRTKGRKGGKREPKLENIQKKFSLCGAKVEEVRENLCCNIFSFNCAQLILFMSVAQCFPLFCYSGKRVAAPLNGLATGHGSSSSSGSGSGPGPELLFHQLETRAHKGLNYKSQQNVGRGHCRSYYRGRGRGRGQGAGACL